MAKRPRGPIAKKCRCLRGRFGPLTWEFWYNPERYGVSAGVWYVGDPVKGIVYRDDRPGGEDVPKPITNKDALAGIAPPRQPGKVLAKLPRVSEYLSDTTWPDGSVMGGVQLAIRTRGALLVAQLKLADHGGLRITAEATCVDDALAALEAALNAEPAPWEKDPYPLDGAVKKKK